MRMIFIPLALAVGGLGVGATVVIYRQSYHPVSWYEANPTAAQTLTAWCSDNVGIARTDSNCQNAADAQSNASFKAFHEMATALPWPGEKGK